jgi:DNA polymerase-3 subunit alpha
LLVAEGPLAVDDYLGTLRLTVEKLYSMDQARDAFARGIQLTWQAEEHDDAFLQRLSAVLSPFKGGGCPVLMNYKSRQAKATVRLGDEWRVQATDELIMRLKRLPGASEVEVKYK